MSDDDPKSSSGAPVVVGRVPTAERGKTRDHRVEKHPPERIRAALAAPSFDTEEVTGQYSGDELRAIRSKRTTSERLERLEVKHDDLKQDFGNRLGRVEIAVADMGGQFKIIPSLINTMQDATKAMQQRDHVTFTAKVDVDKAVAIDVVEASKAKREWITKTIAIGSSIAAIVAALVAAGRC